METLFAAPDLLDRLERLAADEFDSLPFGAIAMTSDGNVTAYNQAEASLSGLTPSRVIGRHFFVSVAPCTNNYLVAHRFENEQALDIMIDYVLTGDAELAVCPCFSTVPTGGITPPHESKQPFTPS